MFLQKQLRPPTLSLNGIVKHAYTNNPFYRQKLAGIDLSNVHRVDDLKVLPLTTREELHTDPWVLLAVPRDSVVQAHLSTGTTGRSPHYILYDSVDLYERGLLSPVSGAPTARLLRIEPGEVAFNALPYEVTVPGMAVHRAVQDGTGACVVPLGKGEADPRAAVRIMRNLRGDHLFTTPSYAVHLAEVASEAGPTVVDEIGLRSVWLIGELCSPALRRRIEGLWRCPVFLYYGSMESGAMGVECSMHDGYHPVTNVACVELVSLDDPSKDAAPGSLGEIVVTPLWRYASPLVRYRTGDLGYWDTSPCRCGIATARLHVKGRVDDMLRIGKTRLHVIDVEDQLLGLPQVSTWFRLRADGDSLCVLLPNSGDLLAVGDLVKHRIAQAFDVPCSVERDTGAGYAGGKFLRVAHNQPKGRP